MGHRWGPQQRRIAALVESNARLRDIVIQQWQANREYMEHRERARTEWAEYVRWRDEVTNPFRDLRLTAEEIAAPEIVTEPDDSITSIRISISPNGELVVEAQPVEESAAGTGSESPARWFLRRQEIQQERLLKMLTMPSRQSPRTRPERCSGRCRSDQPVGPWRRRRVAVRRPPGRCCARCRAAHVG